MAEKNQWPFHAGSVWALLQTNALAIGNHTKTTKLLIQRKYVRAMANHKEHGLWDTHKSEANPKTPNTPLCGLRIGYDECVC